MTTETTLHTIRHAQTTFGAHQRYAGSIDVDLSEKGISDCVAAAAAVAELSVDIVITSSMNRAIETARLLGFEASRCIRTGLCNERRYGVLEGRTWQEVPDIDPPVLFVEVGGEAHSVNPLGGEAFEDVWQRAKAFRDLVLEIGEGRSVLVVSHGVFLQMFHGVLRGSNCIESLASYPASLEMHSFRLANVGLVEESVTQFSSSGGRGF